MGPAPRGHSGWCRVGLVVPKPLVPERRRRRSRGPSGLRSRIIPEPCGRGPPSGAGLLGVEGGGAGEGAVTFPERRGDVRRKGAGRARFKWHSLSSELAAVWAGAGYISGEPGVCGADGDSSGGERLRAQRRSSAPGAPRPRRSRPPEEPRPGPARAAATPQQIWIPRPASPRLPPPGGPRRSGRPRRARPPRHPGPRTPGTPWRPPSPPSWRASAPATRR